MGPLFDLLIISDGGPKLVERIAQALTGAAHGRVAIMLREAQRPSSEQLRLALELRASTRAAGALLLVNDRVDVALAADADGVHLPEAGFSPADCRKLLGPGRVIGVSRHDAAGIARAQREGADYATLSPVHVVPGKAPPLGIEGFAAILRSRASTAGAPALPIYALGGIGCADVAALLGVGARGIAVMREVLSADDPGSSTRKLLNTLSAR